jgi:hypothetical protein
MAGRRGRFLAESGQDTGGGGKEHVRWPVEIGTSRQIPGTGACSPWSALVSISALNTVGRRVPAMAGVLFDNPFYGKLSQAVNGVRKDAIDLERMLNSSFEVAQRAQLDASFHSNVDSQRRQLRWALLSIVQAAEDALRNTPMKVTAEEAVLGGKGPYGSPSPW